jgi:hypothetical protein
MFIPASSPAADVGRLGGNAVVKYTSAVRRFHFHWGRLVVAVAAARGYQHHEVGQVARDGVNERLLGQDGNGYGDRRVLGQAEWPRRSKQDERDGEAAMRLNTDFMRCLRFVIANDLNLQIHYIKLSSVFCVRRKKSAYSPNACNVRLAQLHTPVRMRGESVAVFSPSLRRRGQKD